MADEERRAWQRAAASGDPEARARWFASLLRAGEVDAERLRLLAWLGDPAAEAIVGRPPEPPDERVPVIDVEVTDRDGMARLRATERAVATIDLGERDLGYSARAVGKCVAALRALAPAHAPVGFVVRPFDERAVAEWAGRAFGGWMGQAHGKLLWVRRGEIVEWWVPGASLHTLVAGTARIFGLAPRLAP